ncbi:MAG: thiamine-phosphate kinase [Terriglobales bacterium]
MPLGEKDLIRRIRGLAGGGSAVVTGIGDDAAVLRIPPRHELLVTTDFTIENVHFHREWHRPEVVGWRCLTRGLSDIAAMGGEPLAAFLSVALGGDVPQKWVEAFLKGLLELAKKHKVPLAGGDTAQSAGGIQADIVVVGSVPKGQAVLRSGAKPGDGIYVTGQLGASAMALDRLREGLPLGAERSRHFRPEPRVDIGRWLREKGIPSSMIDVSDGLSTDLEHICQESCVGVDIDVDAIPRARAGRGEGKFVALEYALHGGDDYELVFTSSRPVPSKVKGVSITRIGRTTASQKMRLIEAVGKINPLEARGWEHFKGG